MVSRKDAVKARIKQAREACGLTMKQMAKAIGVAHDVTIARYESGVREPDWDTLERIAQATGRDIAWFFGGDSAGQAAAEPAPTSSTAPQPAPAAAPAPAPEAQAHAPPEVEQRLARVEDALARQTAALEGIGAALQTLAQRPPPNDIVAQELRRLRSDMQALRSEVNNLAAQDEEDGEGDCPRQAEGPG